MSFQGEFFPRPPTKRHDLATAKNILANPTVQGKKRALLQKLVDVHPEKRCVTQREMARALNALPATCPYAHGSDAWIDWVFDWIEAITRDTRAIVEELRMGESDLIICSFFGGQWGAGYCLEWEDGQVEAYLKRKSHEVPAFVETLVRNKEHQDANFRNRNAA